ncbi:MAG: diaminopimelate epimerase [Candidatus Azotimanducaceae bacterium]|jgi:diaminopimelate epimerase
MLLRFTKMHGLGNDFVLLDLISQSVSIGKEQIRALADRRLGVGFDQLLIVEPPMSPDTDFHYRIFNADGSEAEQCGNGARCFLRFVRDRGLTTKTQIRLSTNTGVIEARLEPDGNITIDMGPPVLEPANIPFVAERAQITYPLGVEMPVCGTYKEFDISSVNMGNPHAVLVVDDVEQTPVSQLGPLIENHARFPQRVNVGFMQIISRSEIRLRVFERGTGETRACGTGACAAVVAGRLRGLLDETVEVRLTGGGLNVSWAGDKASVMMTGPASRVYEGRLHI